MTPPILTADHLRRWDVPYEEVEWFDANYPDGLAVTIANADMARAAGLDLPWLRRVLTDEAWEEYQRVVAPAWLDRVTKGTRVEYERVAAPALVAALLSCWDEIGGEG